MATPNRTQNKRRPPIELPSTQAEQAVSGLDAFATAEHRKQAETVNDPLQWYGLPDVSSDSESSPSVRSSNAAKSRLSSKEAYSNLADGVLRSPQKSQKSRHSYASSTAPDRYSFTARLKQSVPGYDGVAAAQMRLEGLGEETTARGAIEAQNDRKYTKMMGQAPETPVASTVPLLENNVKVTDLRQQDRSDVNRESSHQDSVPKSSKKKLWGVNIPFTTRSATKIVAPPMPLKAAKRMGVTPTRRFVHAANIRRSETSPYLHGPSKLYNQPDRHGHRRSPPQERRRSPIDEETKPLSRARRRSPPTQPNVWVNKEALVNLTGSAELDAPPIPPRKDSLAHFRQNSREHPEKAKYVGLNGYTTPEVLKPVKGLLEPPTPSLEPDDFTDSGMQVSMLPAFPLDFIPQNSTEDVKEVYHTSGENKATLVEGPQIVSSYATVRYSSVGEGEPSSRSAPLRSPDRGPLSFLHSERRSAPPTPTVASQSRSPSPELEYLKPTVYVPPPKKEVKKTANLQQDSEPASVASRAVPESIPIVFQGQLSQVDSGSAFARTFKDANEARKRLSSEINNSAGGSSITKRGMDNLRIIHPGEVHEPAQNAGQSNNQSERSSAQLTDMLSGASPSKADFREFHSSSAVPSPLHKPLLPLQPGTVPQLQPGTVLQLQPGIAPQSQPGIAPQSQPGIAPQLQPGTGASDPSRQQPPFSSPLARQPPSGNLSLLDHFFMLNNHMDFVGLTLHDWVRERQELAMRAASSWNEQLKNVVEQQSQDIKSRIDSVSEKANENGNQCHNLGVQLDKLRDFITAELAEFMNKQAQKTSEIEKSMKELQKAMQNLQTSFAQRNSPSLASSSPPHQPYLSNPRSQPNLPAFYDSGGVKNSLAPPGPSGSAAIGRYGVSPHSGRQTYVGEGRESAGNTSMYQAAGASSNNGYGAGDYPLSMLHGYYSMPGQAPPYGYGQGSQK